MGADLDALLELLDVEQLEVNLFRGVSPVNERPRVFGGQVLAQSLIAAGRTVDDERPVHSVHAYFLRPGDPHAPIVFDVDRIRDGRSFTTRRVVAIQHGQPIFNLAASFHVVEDGPEHSNPVPDVDLPEGLAPFDRPAVEIPERLDRTAVPWPGDRPIDLRYVGERPWLRDGPRPPDLDVWAGAEGSLGDDPLLHAAVIAYTSDFMLLHAATLPHTSGPASDEFMLASLDHVMWFHRSCRADEWLLYHVHSPVAAKARTLALSSVSTRDGVHAVTIAQEGLFRPVTERAEGPTANA